MSIHFYWKGIKPIKKRETLHPYYLIQKQDLPNEAWLAVRATEMLPNHQITRKDLLTSRYDSKSSFSIFVSSDLKALTSMDTAMKVFYSRQTLNPATIQWDIHLASCPWKHFFQAICIRDTRHSDILSHQCVPLSRLAVSVKWDSRNMSL